MIAAVGLSDQEGRSGMTANPNIVLVHGAWADGSSWSDVIATLQADGYHVTAPQFPMSSLAADVARLRQVLDFQDGPTVVAGHSYGGQIITALGADAPHAVALVYIAAFGLDQARPSPTSWAGRRGSHCRPGTWSRATTRPFPRRLSGSSQAGWVPSQSRFHRVTWRWSPTPARSPTSSGRQLGTKPACQPADEHAVVCRTPLARAGLTAAGGLVLQKQPGARRQGGLGQQPRRARVGNVQHQRALTACRGKLIRVPSLPADGLRVRWSQWSRRLGLRSHSLVTAGLGFTSSVIAPAAPLPLGTD
jgi:pimeloyl-ACP methyl ester carboxylesterase